MTARPIRKNLSNNKKRKIKLWVNEAKEQLALGNMSQVQELCQQVLGLDDEHADALFFLGVIAETLGDNETARTLLMIASEKQPNNAKIWKHLGHVHRVFMEDEQALICLQRSVRLEQPSSSDIWLDISLSYFNLNQYKQALQAAIEAKKITPDQSFVYLNIGLIYVALKQFSEAEEAYRTSLIIDPDNADTYFALADLNLALGDFEASFRWLEDTIAHNSSHVSAHNLLLIHRKVKQEDPYFNQAWKLYNDPAILPSNKVHLGFALGKAWADLEMYEKSFKCYETSNRIRRKEWQYSVEDDKYDTETIIQVFTKALLDQHTHNKTHDTPVLFILGMPRSGSTLLDQILSSHPDVMSIGEADLMRSLTSFLTLSQTNHIDLKNLIHVTDEQLNEAALLYFSTVERTMGKSGCYVDKALPNIWLIGVIRLVFPQARILHCTRNPMDQCLSIFTHDLSGYLHRYGYNLTELGQYYRLYQKMMAHWREVIPSDRFRDVQYEKIVANPEQEIRDILKFCDLSWCDACLVPHKTKREVLTSSVQQVRQPIYRSSVNRWQHYQPWLGELIEALGESPG